MNPIPSILTLIATTLLSLPASASEGSDPILASFERDMNREPTTQSQQSVRVEIDPLEEALAFALKEGGCR